MTGAWDQNKVAAFSDAFYSFANKLVINSKEKGSGFVLGSGFYLAQTRVLDALWNGLAEDKHDFKILKGRQAGISTLTRAIGIFWLGMHPGMNGAMVFDSDSHTQEARQEIEDMIDNLPPSLGFPTITSRNRYGMRLSNQSRLRFMNAGTRESKSGGVLGRSSGLNYLHASEMCSWVNQEGVQALRNALATNFPDRLFVWESTARGPNVWKTMYEEAKEDDLNQVALFIGWWSNDSLRIEPGTPQFARYGADPPTPAETIRMREVERLYDYRITQEQLAWYRWYTDPGRELDDGEIADAYKLQDQPFTETEAWQLTGSTFFEGGSLTRQSARALTLKYDSYKWFPGSNNSIGFFQSRIERAYNRRDTELKVWEEPLPNAYYVISADPAFGHSERSDHSAIEVLRCYADCVEQVAEFTSTSCLTHQLAWLILALVGWYGTYSGNNVYLIIELNGPGEAVWREVELVAKDIRGGILQNAAREAGLQDLVLNLRNYVYGRSDSIGGPTNSLHWKTTQQLKVAIMERLRDFVHNEGLLIRSHEVLSEMAGVTRDGDTIGAEGKGRDDRTMALAMAIRCWEEKARRGLVAQRLTREADVLRRTMNSSADKIALLNGYMLQNMFARHNLQVRMQQRQVMQMQSRMRLRERRAGTPNAPWRTRT